MTDFLGADLQFMEVTVNPTLSDRLTIHPDRLDRGRADRQGS